MVNGVCTSYGTQPNVEVKNNGALAIGSPAMVQNEISAFIKRVIITRQEISLAKIYLLSLKRADEYEFSTVIKQFVATCGHVKPQKRVPDLGLGLLIRKEFIECQKGKIWLESGKGSGNVFCFLLPKESDYSNESTAD